MSTNHTPSRKIIHQPYKTEAQKSLLELLENCNKQGLVIHPRLLLEIAKGYRSLALRVLPTDGYNQLAVKNRDLADQKHGEDNLLAQVKLAQILNDLL